VKISTKISFNFSKLPIFTSLNRFIINSFAAFSLSLLCSTILSNNSRLGGSEANNNGCCCSFTCFSSSFCWVTKGEAKSGEAKGRDNISSIKLLCCFGCCWNVWGDERISFKKFYSLIFLLWIYKFYKSKNP